MPVTKFAGQPVVIPQAVPHKFVVLQTQIFFSCPFDVDGSAALFFSAG
jgi:hypothetical protein